MSDMREKLIDAACNYAKCSASEAGELLDTLLAILREPDEAMEDAGDAQLNDWHPPSRPAWQAMIDTIAEPARNQPTA